MQGNRGSCRLDGVEGLGHPDGGTCMSADGAYEVFSSAVDSQVPGDTDGYISVFRSAPMEHTWPTWYFAEGYTADGFKTWILVQNPNPGTARVNLFLDTIEGREILPEPQGILVPAYSRISFDLGSYIVRYSVATVVSSVDGMVVCERALYRGGRAWAHDSIGSTQPASL